MSVSRPAWWSYVTHEVNNNFLSGHAVDISYSEDFTISDNNFAFEYNDDESVWLWGNSNTLIGGNSEAEGNYFASTKGSSIKKHIVVTASTNTTCTYNTFDCSDNGSIVLEGVNCTQNIIK